MMKFKDAKDREWSITINVGTIKKLRKELEIDLADPSQGLMERLADDPVLLVDSLWLVCEDQAKERNITAEDFDAALVGDPIDSAVEAMVEAIADFFPQRKRLLLRQVSTRMKEIRERAEKKIMEKINDPSLEEKLEAEMEQAMNDLIQRALTRLNSPTN